MTCSVMGWFGPALFNQGDEQRAGLLQGAEAVGAAGGAVGAAVDGGVGGDYQNVAGL